MEYNKIELPDRLRVAEEAVKEAQITIFSGSKEDSVELLTKIPMMLMDDKNSYCGVFGADVSNTCQLKEGFLSQAKGNFTSNRFGVQTLNQNGAKVTHKLLDTKERVWDTAGLQYTFIGIDNVQTLPFWNVLYMIGRLRSESKYQSKMLLNYNLEKGASLEMKDLIEWHLDDKGCVIEDRQGVVRYFILKEDKFITDTEEELKVKFPELCYIHNPIDDEVVYVKPMSYTFVRV